MNPLVQELLKAPDLFQIIENLNQAWEDEQKKRHEFWAKVDEGLKAEFILGEIIYHSPVYGRHWMASSQLTRKLIPYVYDNQLGMIAYEKVMVRMTRNDYEPDTGHVHKKKERDSSKKYKFDLENKTLFMEPQKTKLSFILNQSKKT